MVAGVFKLDAAALKAVHEWAAVCRTASSSKSSGRTLDVVQEFVRQKCLSKPPVCAIVGTSIDNAPESLVIQVAHDRTGPGLPATSLAIHRGGNRSGIQAKS